MKTAGMPAPFPRGNPGPYDRGPFPGKGAPRYCVKGYLSQRKPHQTPQREPPPGKGGHFLENHGHWKGR